MTESTTGGSQFGTTAEVAAWTSLPESTLRYWRHLEQEKGPRSFRAGRRVLYAWADVEQWIADQRAADSTASRAS